MSDRVIAPQPLRPRLPSPRPGGRPLAAALGGCVLLALVPVTPARADEKGSASFGEQVSVVEVVIPTNVLAGGQPVRGLTREDFRVFEGRAELPIVGFEVVDLAAVGATAEAPPPVAARRHFLFLFDLVNAEPKGVVLARDAALDFVRRGMQPTDLAGVAVFGSRGAELLLAFTSDRVQLELALRTFGVPQLVERHEDPLGLTLGFVGRLVNDTSSSSGMELPRAGRAMEDAAAIKEEEVRDAFLLGATAEANANRKAHEERANDLTRALAGLARLVAAADGRKYAIFFSEGFDSTLLTGEETLSEDARGRRESGEVWRAETEEDMGSGRLRVALERMLEMFRRADVVVQSVDVGGLRAEGRGAGEELLLAMARDTGGQLFTSSNDLREAMDRLAASTAVTYLLSVSAPANPTDRGFRPLTVKLTGGPRGADVRHRQGYFPPALAGQEDPGAARLQIAQRILGAQPGGDLRAAVRAEVLPTEGGPAIVPVLVEVDGEALAGGYQRGSVFAEIYAYAFGGDGEVAAFFTKNVGLDLERVGRALAAGGLAYVGGMQLSPGDYSLRVLVRDPLRGSDHLAVQRLVVPGAGSPPVLAGPWVLGQRGGWVVLAERDQSAAQRLAPRGPTSLPAALPLVPADGETAVELMAFGIDPAAAAVSARAEARAADGAATGTVALELAAGEPLPTGGSRLAGRLRTAGLAAGLHTLTITLLAADGTPIARAGAPILVR